MIAGPGKFFVHVAFDLFAAEALSRLDSWLRVRGDVLRSHHCFLWAGVEDRPVSQSRWVDDFPRWDGTWEFPDPSPSVLAKEVDRRAIAGAVADSVASPVGSAFLSSWTISAPEERFGRNRLLSAQVTCIGSVADPRVSASILGVVDGFERLRTAGTLDVDFALHLCLGAASASLGGGLDSRLARASAARSLLDLESVYRKRETGQGGAFGCYLVGEEGPEGTELDRESLVALTAMAVEAGCDALADSARDVSEEFVNPFLIVNKNDGSSLLGRGDRPFPWQAPFAVVGGYRVGLPVDRLPDVVAMHGCALTFEALESGLSLSTVDMELSAASQRLESETAGGIIAGAFWQETEAVPHPTDSGAATLLMFLKERILEFGASERWKEIFSFFGRERILARPHPQWLDGYHDLCEAIDQVLLPERELQLADLERKTAIRFLDELDRGLGKIAESTFRDPVFGSPHSAMTRCIDDVQSKLAEMLAGLRSSGGEAQSIAEGEERVERLEGEFREKLALIPNPFSLYLRAVPYVVLVALSALYLPGDLLFIDAPGLRFLGGVVLGSAGFAGFAWWHLRGTRRDAVEWFERLVNALQDVLRARDQVSQSGSLSRSLIRCRDLATWFLEGSGRPPVPVDPLPVRKGRQGDDYQRFEGGELADGFSPQRALGSEGPSFLTESRTAYEEGTRDLIASFQPSMLETLLPDITPDRPERVGHLLADALGASFSDLSDAVMAFVGTDCDGDAVGDGPVMVPYRTDEPSGDVPTWRRRFVLPFEQGRDPDGGSCSGLNFWETFRRGVAPRMAQALSLLDTLNEEGTPALDQLRHRYRSFSQPSVAVGGQVVIPQFLVVRAGMGDPLASEQGESTYQVLVLDGDDTRSSILQVLLGVDAESAIFFPNAQQPASTIGRAWKSFSEAPDTLPICLRSLRD